MIKKPPESQHSVPSLALNHLEATLGLAKKACPRESSMPAAMLDGCNPTLSQTWAVNKSQPAICVQSVDAHMSCSSHSDAQFAAFFIDPRAK